MVSDGMQFGWPSPAVPKLLSNNSSSFHLNKEQAKWITNFYIIGNICGLLISIMIFKKMSRKASLVTSCLPVLAAWFGILISRKVWMLFLARFIGGIGRNMIYVVVPMYIGEIANPNIRGALGSLIYGSMNVGVILVYTLTPYLALEVSSSVGLALALTQLALVYFIPESPYYLLTRNRLRDAENSLKVLRQTVNVEKELEDLTQAVARQTQQKSQITQLFKVSSNRRALLILLFLRFVQMFSGVSVMTMHIHSIFQEAGGNFPPERSALIYGVLMLLSCFCTMGIMDRYGRKSLMIFSCVTTAVVLLSQAAYLYCASREIAWLPLLLVIAYIFTYRIGLGTVPMVMVGELFPTNVKVPGVVISDLVYSLSSLLANVVFQYTEEAFGMFAPFSIFGSVCLVTAILSAKYVPETKNKTLEEIQIILKGKSRINTELLPK